MSVENIKIEFKEGFKGTLTAPHGNIPIGNQENGVMPYNMLFGALGSCFYSTFLTVVEKKRLSFEGATIEISGTKREEVPTTLNHVTLKMTVKNPSSEDPFRKSAELAAKYCSVFETISQVAKIDLVVEFDNNDK